MNETEGTNMTQAFHAGQEVEVTRRDPTIPNWNWRKAKILDAFPGKLPEGKSRHYYVQFPDGIRGVFDAEHIREYAIDRRGGWDVCEDRDAPATE
jgi:hypothetical protein